MATTTPTNTLYPSSDSEYESDTSTESLASLETDDGVEHEPEKIIAEFNPGPDKDIWVLVKWENCPILRSSWETKRTYMQYTYPQVVEAWEIELQLQKEGKSKPFDIVSFFKAQAEEEKAARQRRLLRRLKRRTQRVLDILTAWLETKTNLSIFEGR